MQDHTCPKAKRSVSYKTKHAELNIVPAKTVTQPKQYRTSRRHFQSMAMMIKPFFNDKTDSAIKNIFRKEKIDIRLSRRSESLSQKLRPQLSNKPSCIWPADKR